MINPQATNVALRSRLRRALENGTEIDLGHLELPAAMIRTTLLSNSVAHARGLRVKNAQISGHLDLQNVHSDIYLQISGSHFHGNVNLRCAMLSRGLSLSGTTVDGILDLTQSQLAGELDLTGTSLKGNNDGESLKGDRLFVNGMLFCITTSFRLAPSPCGALTSPVNSCCAPRCWQARTQKGFSLDAEGLCVDETALLDQVISVGAITLDDAFHAFPHSRGACSSAARASSRVSKSLRINAADQWRGSDHP